MTADECAAMSQEAIVECEAKSAQRLALARGQQAVRDAAMLFVSDVINGVRSVSHNALAMLGLAAVVAVVFLMGRADVRHTLEAQALGWLMERASERSGALASAAADDNAVLLALAEPEAIQRATATDPAELNRQQANVAYWIARRYNVAPEPVSRLVQEAWTVGGQMGVEPTLVLAVMAIESGFNPFAQSHVGAQGLMQVMTRIHHDKYAIFGGQNAAFDPVTNLRVGVQVLKDCIRKAGSLEGGLKYYVGAANMADDGGYGAKVLAEQVNLRQVAAGVKVPVTVPLPQAVSVQASVPAATDAAASAAGAASPVAPVQAPATAPAASEAMPIPAAPAPVARHPEQVALLSVGH